MRVQNGVHYWYTTKEEFEKGIKEGRFLEYAHVHSNIYGTSYQVNAIIIDHTICLMPAMTGYCILPPLT